MDPADISTMPATDELEPKATWRPVPVWLLVLMLVLLYWGMLYFDQHGGWFSQEVYSPFRSETEVAFFQPPKEGIDLARGKTVFEAYCAICHNSDGNGKVGQAPPLNGSEWLQLAPNRMLRI